MMICDSHVHIGNYTRCKIVLINTKYKDKYKLYNSIDLNLIKNQNNYINNLEKFFAIPIVFKETDVLKENSFVKKYCQIHTNGIPVQIINNNFIKPGYNIWKEHFLLNDYKSINDRKATYEYINETDGFLLIHCKDKIRLEYIDVIHKLYPNINIIIAHLGRDCFENSEFIYNVLKKFNDEKIYYDLSSIEKKDNIIMALNMINNSNLFFGSDYPYVSIENIKKLKYLILEYANNPFDILNNNFNEVVKKLEKSKCN